jgi:hypothetical protein
MKKWAPQLNREFSKEEVQMANKYMKKCSTSLAIKETQTKTALRFHPILLERLSSTQTTTNVDKDAENRNPYMLLVGMQISTTIMENNM